MCLSIHVFVLVCACICLYISEQARMFICVRGVLMCVYVCVCVNECVHARVYV